MIARHSIFRPVISQDPTSLCIRCLRRLSRFDPRLRRPISSTSTNARNAIIPPNQTRNSLKKNCFGTNGILERIGVPSRGRFSSNSTVVVGGDNRAVKSGTTSSSVPGEKHQSDIKQSIADPLEHIPPHRRRRLRRDEVAAAAADSDGAAAYPIAPDASSQLTTLSSQLPIKSLRRISMAYLSLTKPRLSFLVVLTSTAAYSMFPVPALLSPATTAAPSLSTLTLFFLTIGTTLCSSSANSFNMIIEPAHDAKMSRTKNRPLVRKLISRRGAIIFAVATGIIGTAALYYGVNPTTAFLGAINIGLYAGVYTPLKRVSVINTWVGALVGAIPPLMGWTAASGQCASGNGTWEELLFGESSAGGWLLAALLFAWQFPHFNALSWAVREEYKYAGYRMLCWTNPQRNGRVALRYSILMFPISIGLSYVGVTDMGFIVTSSLVNGWMAYEAVRFWRYSGHKGTARALFWASVWHLPIIMVLAMVQKKGLWSRIWGGLTGATPDEMYDDEGEWEEDEKVQAWEGRKSIEGKSIA